MNTYPVIGTSIFICLDLLINAFNIILFYKIKYTLIKPEINTLSPGELTALINAIDDKLNNVLYPEYRQELMAKRCLFKKLLKEWSDIVLDNYTHIYFKNRKDILPSIVKEIKGYNK